MSVYQLDSSHLAQPIRLPVRAMIVSALVAGVSFGAFGVWENRTPVTTQVPSQSPAVPRLIAGVDKGPFLPVEQGPASGADSLPGARDVAIRQAEFLGESTRLEASAWSEFSEEERDRKRAELKSSLLGNR